MGLKVCRQIEIPVWFRGHQVGDFSADMFKRLIFDNPRKAIRENPCLSVAELLTPNK